MSKAQIRTYVFTPGLAGVGTIKVPGKYDLAQLLVITNVTNNTILYNFADPTYSGTTVSFSRANDANFTTTLQNTDGVTTITLAVNTTGQNGHNLQIFFEQPFTYVKQPGIGTDAFERQRVAMPRSMLDADFEYGLQPTKWQTYSLMRGYPSVYEIPGTDIQVTTVTTDASTPNSGVGESLMTVNTVSAHNLTVGTPFTIKGYLTTIPGFSRAEGSFIVNTIPTTTSFTYYAKGLVGTSNGQIMSTTYTVLRKGGFYTGASIGSPTFSYVNNAVSGTTATITVTFANRHGLCPGDTISVVVTSGVSNNHPLVQGPFYIESVPSLTTLSFTARAPGSISGTVTGIVYTRPDAFYLHRPFDGGVMLGTGGPSHGALAVRMSKKYIRYQSGKAINYNTGALFAPSYDIATITASSTLAGATITVVTDNTDHGLQVGATVTIYGVTTSGYNGTYVVSSVVDERTFTTTATSALGSTTGAIQDPCQVSLTAWYGSTVRAGTFDDQNGQFWAHDGITLYVGYRYSTFQLAGVINVTTDSNQLTGTGTRFLSQLTEGDRIVIKGMSHVVTSIVNDTQLFFTPDYRAVGSASTTATGTNGQSTIQVASYTGLQLGMNASGTNIGGGATITSLTSGTFVQAYSQVSISTQAGGASLQNVLTLNSVNNVQVGMTITAATGIPAGTTITSVNAVSVQVTISQNLTTTLSAANVTIGANTISTASSVALLVVGAVTSGSTGGGIANGTVVNSIVTGGTNYIILSNTVTGNPGNVTFSTPYIITLSAANTGAVSGTVNFTTTYSGVVVTKTIDQVIPQNQFNIDRIDGTSSPFNPSGYLFQANKMQMIGIQWTWYGAGFMEWLLRGPDGNYVQVHRIKAANVNTLAYMRSGNQPVRYEVSNEGVYRTYTTGSTLAGDTTINVASTIGFPTAGTLWIDGEIITYTSTTATAFVGCTRGASITQFVSGSQRTFTANNSVGAASNANTGVILFGQTATPIIQHWGSAFITDGGFDDDRGYLFNYQATNISISTKKTTAFAIRLAPSVSNAIIGDLGIRDLINRAQLLLSTLEITAGGTSNTNSALVIEGVINPQNYPTDPANIAWNGLQGNSNTYFSGGQPSFSQIAAGTSVTFDNSSTRTITTTGANISATVITLSSDPIAAGVQVGDDVFVPSITNALFGNTKVLAVQSSPAQVTLSNGLTQALTNGTQLQFSRNTYAVPGETIFSFVSSPANKDSIDLSTLKEMTASPLGGRGTFPNGPDSLFINVYLTQGSPVLANLVLRWGEAQA